jgi:hypothetical protein
MFDYLLGYQYDNTDPKQSPNLGAISYSTGPEYVQSTSRAPNSDWHFVVHFRPAPPKIRQSNEVARHCFPDGADYLGVTLSHFYDLLTVGNGF